MELSLTRGKGGVIRLMEQKLERPLQWCICQLHAELSLRHFLQHIDGSKTTGPNTYSGIIGKLLEVCEKLRVVMFEVTESETPDVDCAELSIQSDQKYLHDTCNAVRSG